MVFRGLGFEEKELREKWGRMPIDPFLFLPFLSDVSIHLAMYRYICLNFDYIYRYISSIMVLNALYLKYIDTLGQRIDICSSFQKCIDTFANVSIHLTHITPFQHPNFQESELNTPKSFPIDLIPHITHIIQFLIHISSNMHQIKSNPQSIGIIHHFHYIYLNVIFRCQSAKHLHNFLKDLNLNPHS